MPHSTELTKLHTSHNDTVVKVEELLASQEGHEINELINLLYN